MQTMMNMIGNRYIILDSGLKKNNRMLNHRIKSYICKTFLILSIRNIKYNLDPYLEFDYK